MCRCSVDRESVPVGPTHVAQSPRGGAVTSRLEQQCWSWGAWLHASNSESDTPGPGVLCRGRPCASTSEAEWKASLEKGQGKV